MRHHLGLEKSVEGASSLTTSTMRSRARKGWGRKSGEISWMELTPAGKSWMKRSQLMSHRSDAVSPEATLDLNSVPMRGLEIEAGERRPEPFKYIVRTATKTCPDDRRIKS